MIDLHLHTTASDGRCAPRELVRRAVAVGIRALAVTDHDTRSGLPDAADEAAGFGLTFLPGIEITSVRRGRDVHVLAYDLPEPLPALDDLLASQRARRRSRTREIAARLHRLGVPIDTEALLSSASERGGKALARPQIARALVDAGHVACIAEAFDRYLGEQCAAYVPHEGASPLEVVDLVVGHGGVAALAHPGHTNCDDLLDDLVDAGMTCLEVFHSSHSEEQCHHYLSLARRYGLFPTGGSDYHGEGTRRAECFGVVGLPAEEFGQLLRHLAERRGHVGE